jgi:hypothetical protein
MIGALKEIPELVVELYEEMSIENCYTALKYTIYNLALNILKAGVFVAIAQFHPYLLGVSCFIGLAIPDICMEITSVAWAAIFQTKDLVPPTGLDTQKRIYQIWFKMKNLTNYFKPIIATGLVCFFGLPVFTGSVIAVFAGLRIGAHFGKSADLTNLKLQPFHK